MVLKNQNILLISPEPWKHISISKHHYARALVKKNNQLFFLNPPSSDYNISQSEISGLTVIDYPGFIKGMRYFPALFQKYLTQKVFEKIEKLCHVKFDIIWNFDTSVFYNLEGIPDRVFKILHLVDLNQDFQFETATKGADLCLGSSKLIVEKLSGINSNSFFINHGCIDYRIDDSFQLDKAGYPIICIYAGNLSIRYIDWRNILKIVDHNPDCFFIFIGPLRVANGHEEKYLKVRDEVFKRENVRNIGTVSSEELNNYYYHADILILNYLDEFRDQCGNPHKMMEYLKSGTPIVASFTLEYENLAKSGLIAMSKSNIEIADLFSDVVNRLDYWNSKEKSDARRKFALNNTYEKQIERIEKILNESLG